MVHELSPERRKSNMSPSETSAEATISDQPYFMYALIRLPSVLADNACFSMKGNQFLTIQKFHVSAVVKLK
jgi:hypothetical protein